MERSVENIRNAIFNVRSTSDFNVLSLEIFRLQAKRNPVYRNYLKHLKVDPERVVDIGQIPFLPISFFKSHQVLWEELDVKQTFLSSGTTGMVQSRHLVHELSLYKDSFRLAFEQFYGTAKDWCILALLPSYLEREGSSLIYMVDDLIQQSSHNESGFYLDQLDELREKLIALDQTGQKVLLLGVTYALLDLIAAGPLELRNVVVMETGGMKGKRKEMVREELHAELSSGFGVKAIHSEYGMTELLSQGYSMGNGVFECPPWMKVMVRDVTDPLSSNTLRRSGGINVIDLANLYSCSFIATQDLGKVNKDGTFEVLGRFDNSDVRGCNLLVQ